MIAGESGSGSTWSRDQDRAFENALAIYPEDSSDRWEKIAADVPGKTLEQIKHHYKLLKEDVQDIESGRVSLPCYISSSDGSASHGDDETTGKKGDHHGYFDTDSNHGCKGSRSDPERRKGIAWTEEEHRLFLLGLEKYGKGDWRSISRNFVVTRTPTQVASHAQKYFIRLNSMNKDRRRSSIHDITSVGNGSEAPGSQGPITGQTPNGPLMGVPSGKPTKQHHSQSPVGPGPPAGMTIGQPVGGHLVSAVGTPVSFPGPSPIMYGMRAALVPGPLVSGAPMAVGPMAYPVPHPSAQR